MDPVTLAIVSGLASGVAAEVTQRLISALSKRSNQLAQDLTALEAAPTSEALQRGVSAEISQLVTNKDEEILELSKQILNAIEREEPGSDLNRVGIELSDIEAANVEIDKLVSSDGGVRVKNIRASGNFKLGEVSVSRSDPKD